MLYLAEVQKKSGGVFGGGKAELKLLACQRSEQSWTAVPGDEVVPFDDSGTYAAGTLVLVDLTANRQVQRVQEAGRPLVSILQNFSRLQEKFKTQEEEIEQWKQSLTYQSQELNRREMEMESRREELQQMESDFEQFEQRRQELEALQEETNRQRQEFERNRQELEGAWDHLRGEMRRLEERQSDLQQSSGLSDEQSASLQELLNRLASAVPSTDIFREQVTGSLEVMTQQQSLLNQYWQVLEQQRSQVQQGQEEVERQAQDLQARWQAWHEAQSSLEQLRSELKAQQSVLTSKQEYARLLSVQLQNQDDLHQQIYRLADGSDKIKLGGQPVDIESLEKMPLDALQQVVQDLESDLEKLSRFVESQEEELRFKQDEIEALKTKIQAANEFDRLSLENELVDEEDGYQMLNETLVGQRRNLQERKGVLGQHQKVLRRRQGIADSESADVEVDLGPILGHVEALRHQQAEELHKLEGQVEQMQIAIRQAEDLINSQAAEQDNRRHDLKQQESTLTLRRSEVAVLQGRLAVIQECLQPIQDGVDTLKQKLEAAAGTLAQVQESGDYQLQAIAEMRQIMTTLTSTPELAAS